MLVAILGTRNADQHDAPIQAAQIGHPPKAHTSRRRNSPRRRCAPGSLPLWDSVVANWGGRHEIMDVSCSAWLQGLGFWLGPMGYGHGGHAMSLSSSGCPPHGGIWFLRARCPFSRSAPCVFLLLTGFVSCIASYPILSSRTPPLAEAFEVGEETVSTTPFTTHSRYPSILLSSDRTPKLISR